MGVTLEGLGIDQMSVPDRLRLAELIWDSVTESGEKTSIPEWHIEELERRCVAADADSDAGIPWAEVRDRLLAAE